MQDIRSNTEKVTTTAKEISIKELLGSARVNSCSFGDDSSALTINETQAEMMIDKSFIVLSFKSGWAHKIIAANLIFIYLGVAVVFMKTGLTKIDGSEHSDRDLAQNEEYYHWTSCRFCKLFIMLSWISVLLCGDVVASIRMMMLGVQFSSVIKVILMICVVISGSVYSICAKSYADALERSAAVLILSKMDQMFYTCHSHMLPSDLKASLEKLSRYFNSTQISTKIHEMENNTRRLAACYAIFQTVISISLLAFSLTISANDKFRKYVAEC